MIFIVDEDYSALEGWTADIDIRGYTTEALWDADEAFERLRTVRPEEVELAIIDVMLAVDDPATSRFTAAMTDGYLRTGLCLVEALAQQNPDVFPRRAVFLTNTVDEGTLSELRRVTSRWGVELWRKHRIASPLAFADMVEARIKTLGTFSSPPRESG
jgi:CheY-like chemotaxis protein